MTQTFVSKVDSNQLLTQVMLIQLKALETVLMTKTWTKSVHIVYISCSTAFLQQEVHPVS